jgi:hypothetical protein
MVDRFKPTFMALRPMERLGMEKTIPTVTADYHRVTTIGLPSEAPAYMHRSNWTPYEVWERTNASCRRP